MKNFKQYNENVKDLLVGKSNDEVMRVYNNKIEKILSEKNNWNIIGKYCDNFGYSWLEIREEFIKNINIEEVKRIIKAMSDLEIDYIINKE